MKNLKTPVNFGKSAVIPGKDLYWISEFYYDRERKKWSTNRLGMTMHQFNQQELQDYISAEKAKRHQRNRDPAMSMVMGPDDTPRRLRIRKITVVEEGYVDV